MTAANLDDDTRAVRRADGRYALELPRSWSFLTPSGGVLLGVVLRAMDDALAEPAQEVVSATAIFTEPIREGPLVVDVDVLRRGGAASQLEATLANDGASKRGMKVVATFARERAGVDVTGRNMPKVPAPGASRPAPARTVPLPFFENFEDRVALGHLWREPGWEAGEAAFARWMRYLEPPRHADGSLPEYALPGMADLMPPALLQALGPDTPRFHAPSLDLTMHFFARPRTEWVLLYVRALRATKGTASCSVELWDEEGRLLAYATQVMMLRRWPGRS